MSSGIRRSGESREKIRLANEPGLPLDGRSKRGGGGLRVIGLSANSDSVSEVREWFYSPAALRQACETDGFLPGNVGSPKSFKNSNSAVSAGLAVSFSTYPPPDMPRASTADPAQSSISRGRSLPELSSAALMTANQAKPHLQSSPSRRKALVQVLRSQQLAGTPNADGKSPAKQQINRLEQLIGGLPLNAQQERSSMQRRFANGATNAKRIEQLRKLAVYPPILPAQGSSNTGLSWGLDKVLRPLSQEKGNRYGMAAASVPVPNGKTGSRKVLGRNLSEAKDEFRDEANQGKWRSCKTKNSNAHTREESSVSESNLDWLSRAKAVDADLECSHGLSTEEHRNQSKRPANSQLTDTELLLLTDEFELLRPWTGESTR